MVESAGGDTAAPVVSLGFIDVELELELDEDEDGEGAAAFPDGAATPAAFNANIEHVLPLMTVDDDML